MSAGSAPPPRTRMFLYGSSCPLLRVVQTVLRPTSAVARGHMERSDRAVASTGVAHTVVLRRGLSYRSRQHGKLGLASRSVKTGRQHGRGGGADTGPGGRGGLEQIAGCHLPHSLPSTPSLFFHVFCPRGQNAREQHMSAASWTFLVVCCGGRTSNHRNITLVERAKWALFLKSFFEISEAIPWPRDHILFTFPLPTTQATLAKFTKEDPHWKIRLIPD